MVAGDSFKGVLDSRFQVLIEVNGPRNGMSALKLLDLFLFEPVEALAIDVEQLLRVRCVLQRSSIVNLIRHLDHVRWYTEKSGGLVES